MVKDPRFIRYRDELTQCIHGNAPLHQKNREPA